VLYCAFIDCFDRIQNWFRGPLTACFSDSCCWSFFGSASVRLIFRSFDISFVLSCVADYPDYLSVFDCVLNIHISHRTFEHIHHKQLHNAKCCPLLRTGEFLLVIANPRRSSDHRHATEVSIAETESQWNDNWPRLVGQYWTAAWSGREHHQRNKQQSGDGTCDQSATRPVVLDGRDYLHVTRIPTYTKSDTARQHLQCVLRVLHATFSPHGHSLLSFARDRACNSLTLCWQIRNPSFHSAWSICRNTSAVYTGV